MEKIIIKNNLEHIVRGNMLDGHKRDILAWALKNCNIFGSHCKRPCHARQAQLRFT